MCFCFCVSAFECVIVSVCESVCEFECVGVSVCECDCVSVTYLLTYVN